MGSVVECERDSACRREPARDAQCPGECRRERRRRRRAPCGRCADGADRRDRPSAHERILAPMTPDVAMGALAAAAASGCFEISYALQALEARRVQLYRTVQVSLLARLARRPLWLGAIALAVAGWPLQLVALALAPLTLVQPVLALGVVLLLVLAARILHERIGGRELLCCAGIILGVSGIAWAAPARSTSHAGPLALGLALGALGAFVAAPYVAAA